MRFPSSLITARVLALAVACLLAANAPLWGKSAPCHRVLHEDSEYTVCEVDLTRHAVRLYWKRPDGEPYAYLSALPRTLDAHAPLLFATNAGMFDPSLKPVGLYVENGRELVGANTRSGHGNFHMKPNGVFFMGEDTAGVLETGAFLRRRPRVDIATQSGPMLVIDGRLHPRFDHNSTSLKARSGVGVRDARTVLFAISEQEVTFAQFANLFRQRLQCMNALFLDGGSASSMYVPSLARGGNFLPLGPMLAVFSRAERPRADER
jgi:uncharacterized protein YigE (DUF2233 family)